mgnify:CR=1 FL=1
MKVEDVILNLIKMEKERNGGVAYEPRIIKMATLLNISPDRYERVRERLIERGKIGKDGIKLFLQ